MIQTCDTNSGGRALLFFGCNTKQYGRQITEKSTYACVVFGPTEDYAIMGRRYLEQDYLMMMIVVPLRVR